MKRSSGELTQKQISALVATISGLALAVLGATYVPLPVWEGTDHDTFREAAAFVIAMCFAWSVANELPGGWATARQVNLVFTCVVASGYTIAILGLPIVLELDLYSDGDPALAASIIMIVPVILLSSYGGSFVFLPSGADHKRVHRWVTSTSMTRNTFPDPELVKEDSSSQAQYVAILRTFTAGELVVTGLFAGVSLAILRVTGIPILPFGIAFGISPAILAVLRRQKTMSGGVRDGFARYSYAGQTVHRFAAQLATSDIPALVFIHCMVVISPIVILVLILKEAGSSGDLAPIEAVCPSTTSGCVFVGASLGYVFVQLSYVFLMVSRDASIQTKSAQTPSRSVSLEVAVKSALWLVVTFGAAWLIARRLELAATLGGSAGFASSFSWSPALALSALVVASALMIRYLHLPPTTRTKFERSLVVSSVSFAAIIPFLGIHIGAVGGAFGILVVIYLGWDLRNAATWRPGGSLTDFEKDATRKAQTASSPANSDPLKLALRRLKRESITFVLFAAVFATGFTFLGLPWLGTTLLMIAAIGYWSNSLMSSSLGRPEAE